MKSKKGLEPVVAIALILVVAVVSVVAFQSWFQNYSSVIFSDIDSTKIKASPTVETLVNDKLYLQNPDNSKFVSLKIELENGTKCDLLKEEEIEGVVGNWKFENYNSTHILDSSSLNNNGVNSNGVVVLNSNGINENYGRFNGSNEVIVPFHSDLEISNNGGSAFAWFRIEDDFDSIFSGNENGIGIFFKQGHINILANQPFGLGVYKKNAVSSVKMRGVVGASGGSVESIDSSSDLFGGIWYFGGFTWNSSSVSLYLNGELESSKSRSVPISYESQRRFWIGKRFNFITQFANFKGDIDEVLLFDRVLSENEVAKLYSSFGGGSDSVMNFSEFDVSSCNLNEGEIVKVVGTTHSQMFEQEIIVD